MKLSELKKKIEKILSEKGDMYVLDCSNYMISSISVQEADEDTAKDLGFKINEEYAVIETH